MTGPNLNDDVHAAPVLRTGRAVRLEALRPEHTEFLYELAIDETVGFRWRFGGVVPRRDVFEQSLWTGVLTQFVICAAESGGAIGSIIAYNADLSHGYAYVAAGMTSEAAGTGIGIEAVDLFIAHLFACYNLRKLYFDMPEYNLDEVRSAIGGLLKEEGNLKAHTYYRGRYWDRTILAMYREDYEAIGEERLFGMRRRGKSQQ